MSRAARSPEGCGCTGCRRGADAAIEYRGGERIVCARHAKGHRVLRWFGGVE